MDSAAPLWLRASLAASLTASAAGLAGFVLTALDWNRRSVGSLAVAVGGGVAAVGLLLRRWGDVRVVRAALPPTARAVLFEWTVLESAAVAAAAMDAEPMVRLAKELAPVALAANEDELRLALEHVSRVWRHRLTAKGLVRAALTNEQARKLLAPLEEEDQAKGKGDAPDTAKNNHRHDADADDDADDEKNHPEEADLDAQVALAKKFVVARAVETKDKLAEKSPFVRHAAAAVGVVAHVVHRVRRASNEELQVWLVMAFILVVAARQAIRISLAVAGALVGMVTSS